MVSNKSGRILKGIRPLFCCGAEAQQIFYFQQFFMQHFGWHSQASLHTAHRLLFLKKLHNLDNKHRTESQAYNGGEHI